MSNKWKRNVFPFWRKSMTMKNKAGSESPLESLAAIQEIKREAASGLPND